MLWSSLTEIERRVPGLLVDGADGRTIASELQISRSEVTEHIQSLLSKLNVHSRLEAASKAVSAGFLGHVPLRPIRVLIVDDHDLFAEAIKAVLSDAAIDVAAILGTGREAIDYALEHRPDVVILDLGLPDMSGLAAGRKILESWPDAKLVALTALDDPGAISDAITIGVDVRSILAVQAEASELREPDARVGEQTDNRGVAPVLEVVSRGALQDRLHVGGRRNRDRLLRDRGRVHPRHG